MNPCRKHEAQDVHESGAGFFCRICEIERMTAEIEQLRNKLMEGENLAQEFSYFGMRNEIGKKHPALQKRIDDFIKSSFPLLLTKGKISCSHEHQYETQDVFWYCPDCEQSDRYKPLLPEKDDD